MSTNYNAVGWFEIYVQDMERARAFYETTFEVTLTSGGSPDFEMWMFPTKYGQAGAPGALVKYPGKDSGGGGVIIYFNCDDCSEEAARALANGGKMQREKMAIGEYGFIILIHDPDGNLIGLHSMK